MPRSIAMLRRRVHRFNSEGKHKLWLRHFEGTHQEENTQERKIFQKNPRHKQKSNPTVIITDTEEEVTIKIKEPQKD